MGASIVPLTKFAHQKLRCSGGSLVARPLLTSPAMSSRAQTTKRMPSMRPLHHTEPAHEGALPKVPPTADISEIAEGLDRWALRREKNVLFRDPARAAYARRLAARARFISAALDAGVREAARDWPMLQQQMGDLLGAPSREAALGALS